MFHLFSFFHWSTCLSFLGRSSLYSSPLSRIRYPSKRRHTTPFKTCQPFFQIFPLTNIPLCIKIHINKSNRWKRGVSFSFPFQRVAAGVNAIWRELPNGLLRAVPNHTVSCSVGTDGFRYRYQCGIYVGICKVDLWSNWVAPRIIFVSSIQNKLYSWDFFICESPGRHSTLFHGMIQI